MANEREIQKMNEILKDAKNGRKKLRTIEFYVFSEYLNSLKDNK